MDRTVLRGVTVQEVTVTQLLADVIVNLEPRDIIVNRVSMSLTQLLVDVIVNLEPRDIIVNRVSMSL